MYKWILQEEYIGKYAVIHSSKNSPLKSFLHKSEAEHFCDIANSWKPFTGDSLKKTRIWCTNMGLHIKDGIVILFKAVNSLYQSPFGFSYIPGTIPAALDWDGGQLNCGGGLHFCDNTISARNSYLAAYNSSAFLDLYLVNRTERILPDLVPEKQPIRYLACPIRVDEIKPPIDEFVNNVKAFRCCNKIWEVDSEGFDIQ